MNYTEVGGKLYTRGQRIQGLMGVTKLSDDFWDFGYLCEQMRTRSQAEALEESRRPMERFRLIGTTDPTVKKVDLSEIWNHASVVAALGWAYPGTWQLTGSCVGAGGGNVEFTLAAWEVLRLNDPEQIILPWWPYTYGRSRFHMGSGGQGEGSLESTWAKAAIGDGVINANAPGTNFPKPVMGRAGYKYTSGVEMQWSAGGRTPCTDYLTEGRKHLIKKAAICRDHNDVRTAIQNGYPVGHGSMYGYTDWVDADGLSLGKRGPQWSHKESIHGWMEHPKYGQLFKNYNQWDAGSTSAGFNYVWIPAVDVDWICRDECYAYSQFDGFPAQTFVYDM